MSAGGGRLLGPPLARAAVDAAPSPAVADPPLPLPEEEVVHPIHLPTILAAAWELDPATTLKLICNLRGVRGTGKGDREGFYTAALWLHENHPATLAANLSAFAEFGYLKDLLEILYRLVQGADARKVAKEAGLKRLRQEADLTVTGTGPGGSRKRKRARGADQETSCSAAAPPEPAVAAQVPIDPQPEASESEVDANATTMATPAAAEEKGPTKKALRAATKARLAVEKQSTDASYSNLFDSIVKFFGDRLLNDLAHVKDGQPWKIGLAAKWCPSVGSSFDQTLLICEAIARHIFPKDKFEKLRAPMPITDEQYTYHALRCLRRDVLVPLRKVLGLPELYMTSHRWSELPYERVAAQAMKQYTHLFEKHDLERFQKFQKQKEQPVSISWTTWQSKMKAGIVLPPDIIALTTSKHESTRNVAAETWQAMVDRLPLEGKLTDCVIVSDVLGCAVKTERKVCVALSMLVSQLNNLSQGSCTEWVFPFSLTPTPHPLPHSFAEKIQDLRSKLLNECTGQFDLIEVFDWILSIADYLKLKPEQMVKTIFVITNKDFELASVREWKSDYALVRDSFNGYGFGDVVPQVVYWNIVGPRSAALTSTKHGVMRLSGYSDELMKLFLELGGVVEPEDEMNAAITGEAYRKLIALD
ncbi:hypothetical protein ACQ4PT_044459 [Festuca glaucescens]